MSAIGHEMIFASAGSGKTYALTTRFIRLLAWGVPPERIAALTFTRKAAGEFFREILSRLARAAEDETVAVALARAVGRPGLEPADFRRLLRQVVAAMPRLTLGTLDGFFARIVRAFPLELGLSGEPEILEEVALAEEIRRVLGRMFAAGAALTAGQRDLVEAFKLATFGTEGKAVARQFDRFVGEHLMLYRAAPQAELWGECGRIWPAGFPWGDGREDAAAAGVLMDWLHEAPLGAKPRERWVAFLGAMAGFEPGGPLPAAIEYVLERTLAVWPELVAGSAVLKFERQVQPLTPAAGGALVVLVRRVVALELGRRLRMTQGIGAVLRAFDERYDAEVRRRGRLTFADLQQLLAPARTGSRLAMTDAGAGRWLLDYRLDGRIDHWLFDEFQDTSYPQWQILENLVDEVVQDGSGRRSLFYVGDVKQAIFTWREGDPRLFTHVQERYRHAPGGGVTALELNDSRRSGPAVIQMVNTVCGAGAVIERLFPEAAASWNAAWRSHRSAQPERNGQAALLWVADEEARWAATLRLLQEIRPVERGLTCAVLVRRNEVGARLADYLRRAGGIPAVADADLAIAADNPVTAALTALLTVAAHPGDMLARRHLAMSPLAGWTVGEGEVDRLSRDVLGAVQAAGFAAWIAQWAGRICDHALATDDAFSRMRLEQLIAAGRAFDEGGTRSIDAFLRYLEAYSVREAEGAQTVRVMTIHKSKGLGFDVVLLPDLEGNKLAQRRDGPAVQKADDRSISWILEYPGALIAGADPVLRGYRDQAVAENCYEQLSLLYVALTRAKRAVYAVVEPPGRSVSLNHPRWLVEALGAEEKTVRVGGAELPGAWSAGEPDWFCTPAAEPAPTANLDEGLTPIDASPPPRFTARTASASQTGRIKPAALFTESAARAADFGTRVHARLAQIEWADETGAPEPVGGFAPGTPEREALNCLRAPDLRTVFARPGDDCVVWRERAFEAVLNRTWVSGIFDRVVVECQGPTPVRAWIYDFKTDREAEARLLLARHAAQLNLYRRVLARLLGLSEDRIAAAIVATASRRQVSVPVDL